MASKITITTWKVGGNKPKNIYNTTAANAYTNEYTNPAESTTETKKIGLMYTSDYGFAASPSAWTSTLDSYDSSSITGVNWMYMGIIEWTIVRNSSTNDISFYVNYDGSVDENHVGVSGYARGIRPVFYLESSINYVSGDGTKNSPIRIN